MPETHVLGPGAEDTQSVTVASEAMKVTIVGNRPFEHNTRLHAFMDGIKRSLKNIYT